MPLIVRPILVNLTALQLADVFWTEVRDALFSLRWALLLVTLLVITDFWTGVTASIRVRREDFHKSRAIRRTLTKLCEYLSYLVFAVVIYECCFLPFGIGTATHAAAIAALLVLYCECDSIYEHLCDIHGYKKKFSLKRFLVAYLKRKNEDVGEALEDSINGNKEEKTDGKP